MSDDLPLDPNLRGLLAELAERPESMALGAHVRRFQDVLKPDAMVLRPMTGMGAIETKLLEAHRDELAHLLLQASQIKMTQASILRFVTPWDRRGNPRLVDQDRWRRDATRHVNRGPTRVEPEGSLNLLRGALSPVGSTASSRDLAITSLRLLPRTATKIWVGVYSGLEGDRERGIQLQRSVLDDLTDGFLAAYALSNVAWLSNELGRFHDGVEAGRQATLAEPALLHGPVIWFLSAIQLGSRPEASRASLALADALMHRPLSLREHVDLLRKQRSRSLWAPTSGAESVVQELSGHIPAEAEQLLETFR